MIAKICLAVITACALVMTTVADEDLTGIKCVVNGKKAAKAGSSVEYMGGKVYFCCGNCVKAFEADVKLKDKAKFATKANHQLVLTGQFVQKGCPISGGAVDEDQTVEVGGAKVGFCCEKCVKKVNDAEGLDAKAELVFANAAFKKGFEKKKEESDKPEIDLSGVKCMLMPAKNVSAKQAVDYNGGKVYFCCKRCVAKFSKDPEKYAALANHQMVATGQYVQTSCPFSGGKLNDSESTEVGGVTVKFCCGNCKGKVEAAESVSDKAELVFSKKAFEKGFAAKK
jgi:YHS domain-containing protein